MSGRIRTVKPEWLEDEKLCSLSDEARVLSIALIVMADDYGNGRGNERRIASQVWGYHPREGLARVSRACIELSEIGFVRFYEVAGERYYHVTHWTRHQRVDKPGKPRVPAPNSRESRESPARPTGLTPTPTPTITTDDDADPRVRARRGVVAGETDPRAAAMCEAIYEHVTPLRPEALQFAEKLLGFWSPRHTTTMALRAIRELGAEVVDSTPPAEARRRLRRFFEKAPEIEAAEGGRRSEQEHAATKTKEQLKRERRDDRAKLERERAAALSGDEAKAAARVAIDAVGSGGRP